MSSTFKFPNQGYEVVVCRRADIMQCIDDNITDKEVAMEVIEHLERIATDFISQGRWTSIPFMGSVRIPKTKQMIKSEEQQLLVEDASSILDNYEFVAFKKRLNHENYMKVQGERYYKYVTSLAIGKNKQLYNQLVKEHGIVYARLYLYFHINITAITNEYKEIDDDIE